jgi:Domain of unknown function (DUF4337)
MSEFNAARTLREVDERREQFESGANKRVPIITAIIAVFAALATLFSNHDSVKGLQMRTQAGITEIKASDQFNYYESKRIKAEVNQALLQSGLVKGSATVAAMKSRIGAETEQASGILKLAQAEEQQSEAELAQAERSMASYEFHEVAATLFEVSIVLVSITALMTRSRALIYVAGGASIVGLVFFIGGLVR